MLYLVATPIGNLGDITARALDALRSADIVAAEDTRVSRKLLSHFGIKTSLVSYHEHSGDAAMREIVRRMVEESKSVAIVTDAGSPAISDPGVDLVAGAIAAGARVVPIPGPSALVAALTASGLPTARFVFEGFLPRTKSTRLKKLAALAREERTVIFYESPQRLGTTLAEIGFAFGPDRRACVAREMTKIFEEFRRSTLSGLAEHYQREKTRGECVIVVAGAEGPAQASAGGDARLLEPEAERADAPRGKELIRLLAEELGVPRRDVYQMALQLKRDRRP